MNLISLHWHYIKMKYAARMAYRVDFFLSVLAFFVFQLIGPLFVAAIYSSGGQFEGWTLHQALLLQGVLLTTRGFGQAFFMGILWRTINFVRRGELEILLLRPVNSLRLLIMEGYDDEDIAQFIGGIVVLLYALAHLEFHLGRLLLMLALMLLGLAFLFALAVLCSAATIQWVNTWRLYEFLDIFSDFASYPKNIYSKALDITFITILPLFLLAHFPASAFLGFSLEGLGVATISVIILNIAAYKTWHHMIRHYSGAGG